MTFVPQNDVKSPRSTRYTHQVTPAAAADEIKGVELVVGTLNPGTGGSADPRSRSNSGEDPVHVIDVIRR